MSASCLDPALTLEDLAEAVHMNMIIYDRIPAEKDVQHDDNCP